MGTLEEGAPRQLPEQALQDFVERWGLDQKSQQFLAGLPEDVQREVVAGFDPPPGTRNVDAKLHAFARRVGVDLGHPELAPQPWSGGGGGGGGPAAAPAPRQQWAGGKGLEDPVRDFAAKWGLDESCEQMLRSQSAAVVEDVVANFAPDPNTRNVNGKLYAFVKAKQGARVASGGSRSTPRPVPESNLVQFAVTWNLDETAMQMLRKLSPDVCFGVLADFNPPSDTQNVNAKLNAFVKARLEKSGLSFPPEGQADVVPPWRTETFDPVRRFIENWGCDAQCESALRQLHPDHQAMVMREFDPPPGTYNISGKLSSFIRSVVSRGWIAAAPPDPAAKFAAHWGLDAEAWQMLQNLPEDLQSRVMAEFSPPPGTQNVSGRLSCFIRAKLSAAGDGRAPRGPVHSRSGSDPESALAGFRAQWRLDDEAVGLLRSLPEDVMQGVVRDFQPRSDTWNPSGRLHAFVRARLKELELDGAYWAGDGQSSAAGPGVEPPAGDEIGDFVARWGLDRSSDDLLRGLPEDVLSHVLSGFEPQPNTRNRNAKLMTWVRSLQSQMGGGDAKRQRLV